MFKVQSQGLYIAIMALLMRNLDSAETDRGGFGGHKS